MFLRPRPVETGDLDLCSQIARNRFAFPGEEDRAGLVQMWRDHLGDGRMVGAILEDSTAPPKNRIAWLCFKVFVTDAWTQQLKDSQAVPLPAWQLFDRYQRREKLPILSLDEIRRENSQADGGLNMLVTHYGSPYPLQADNPQWNEVAGSLLDFTDYFSSGYRTKEILEEFYDDYTTSLALGAGFCPRNDFEVYFGRYAAPPINQRARLLGATADEARKQPGTIASVVFNYQHPCFHFKPAEQELLVCALLGDTDKEIASRLCLAEVTLRKRWSAIYERIANIAPRFFLASGSSDKEPLQNAETGRGLEKRRYLLLYLRRHLSELRPLESPDTKNVLCRDS